MRAAAAFLASVITAIGGGAATSTPAAMPYCTTITKTLQFGARGAEVVKLQQILKVSPTGYFGPATKASLVRWQMGKGIIPSGSAPGAGTTGPKTRAALGCPIASAAPLPLAGATTTASSTPAVSTTTQSSGADPLPSGNSSSAHDDTGGIAPGCAPFTVLQPSNQCAWGWEKVIDESGCYVEWGCFDPEQEG